MRHLASILFAILFATSINANEKIKTGVTGEKLRVKHTTAVEGLTVPLGQTLELTAAQTMDVDSVDYWGSLRITKSHVGLNHGAVGLTYQFGGGYFALTPEPAQTGLQYVPTFHYYVNDYQGNVRLVVDGNGSVEQRNDYYAYGGPWGDNAATQGFQPNKYNGKELDRMHGLDWYDYGARMYDPAMGLFTQIDPLAEQYPHLNPYMYCAGNPVKYVDPDGRKVIFINGKIGGGSPKAGSAYWNGRNSIFVRNAGKFFKDYNFTFAEKDYGYLSSASHRVKAGYDYAKAHYQAWKSNMSENETFKLVSHSMGGAFSKGIENYLKDLNNIVIKWTE